MNKLEVELEPTLCRNHDTAMFEIRNLKGRYKNNKDIVDTCTKVLIILRLCKKQGQRIENRTRRYRNAIESLGFTRSK